MNKFSFFLLQLLFAFVDIYLEADSWQVPLSHCLGSDAPLCFVNICVLHSVCTLSEKVDKAYQDVIIKCPLRDACLCMGDLQAPPAPPAPHFVFLITL